MFTWIYHATTKMFLYGGPGAQNFDAGTEALVVLERNPRPRTERYDDAGGIRPATADEIADYDSMQSSRDENARFNGDKVLKALVVLIAGKHGVTVQEARAELIAIYRGLP